MNISSISFNSNNSNVPRPIQNLPKKGLASDVFQKSAPAITFEGLTANKINNATCLNANKGSILQRPDGGFLVDNLTNTVVYYGIDAKNFLEHTNYFPNETQVAAQSGCKLKVDSLNNEGYVLDEPGAVVIPASTRANVKVLEGNPIVVTCENAPDWHQSLEANGVHKDYFNKLVEQNRQIFSNPINRFNKFQNSGEVKKDNFPHSLYCALIDADILKCDDEKIVWDKFYKIGELEQELKNKTDLSLKQIKEVEKIWEQTTKSGFDATGLLYSTDEIAVYSHKNKLNLCNFEPSAWMTNSSEWLPKSASTIGISRVYIPDKGISAFNETRKDEKIHRHGDPDSEDKKQVETYILTQGMAALYCEEGDKGKIKLLKAGDLLVVPAGVTHGVVAISDDYEQVCIKMPSGFQYGPELKGAQREFPSEMIEQAKASIKIQKNVELFLKLFALDAQSGGYTLMQDKNNKEEQVLLLANKG